MNKISKDLTKLIGGITPKHHLPIVGYCRKTFKREGKQPLTVIVTVATAAFNSTTVIQDDERTMIVYNANGNWCFAHILVGGPDDALTEKLKLDGNNNDHIRLNVAKVVDAYWGTKSLGKWLMGYK